MRLWHACVKSVFKVRARARHGVVHVTRRATAAPWASSASAPNASLLQYGTRWGEAHKWRPAGYRGCHGTLGNLLQGEVVMEIWLTLYSP